MKPRKPIHARVADALSVARFKAKPIANAVREAVAYPKARK